MSVNQELIKNIQCTILPGKYKLNQKIPEIYNKMYLYWKNTWSDFFEKSGSPKGSLNIENFHRHDFLIVLHTKDEHQIAGSLLSTSFPLKALSTYDHPCVSLFPSSITTTLKEMSKGFCITAEYLSVHPEFRKSLIGVSLADILVGLQMQLFEDIQADISLATTVRKAKVDEIGASYGYKPLGSYEKCGVDCIMMVNTKETNKRHKDPLVANLVDLLWKNKIDETHSLQKTITSIAA
ncbi:MAG: hypothetical protein M9962_03930 [Oligoflexia bacterium]|nr:hypothetical protein [Oligoflexia bacterium]